MEDGAAERHQTGSPTSVNKLATKIRKMTWQQFLLALAILALLIFGIIFAVKYNQSQNDVQRLSNPQTSAKEEAKRITEAVSKLVEIPNETPTLATVSDASKLKNQAFFAKAENGDKVLIFTQAKEAILYRPSTNKIIQIAPVNLGNNTNPTPTATPKKTTR